jgi:glyoxylase-like metal-dependent hydrolase (beta-lactamase superfamily II)
MRVDQVADGIYRAVGTEVNWYLLTDGTDVALVDAGYPGDIAAVEASIREIGRRPEDLQAVLITHAHIDHVGAVNHLHERYGVAALTGPVEAAHARREFVEQAGPADVLRHAFDAGVLGWSLRITRAGAMKHATIAHATAVEPGQALDLPGRPVPVVTPGHTSGHTCFSLPPAGALLTGDTVATAHATSKRTGPQLLPAWFDHDRAGVEAAVTMLSALDADLVLPGHGDPWRGRLADVEVV